MSIYRRECSRTPAFLCVCVHVHIRALTWSYTRNSDPVSVSVSVTVLQSALISLSRQRSPLSTQRQRQKQQLRRDSCCFTHGNRQRSISFRIDAYVHSFLSLLRSLIHSSSIYTGSLPALLFCLSSSLLGARTQFN